jgi:large subunit ribosomal protein L11
MAKPIKAKIKLQVPGGQATPAPPVGPALGQQGVNIGGFVNQFNDRTKDQQGIILPVVITVYADNTFDFIVKKPPAAILLKRAAEVVKGSGLAGREQVAQIGKDKVREIAKVKMEDMNTSSLEAAQRTIEGTARSLGIEIVG